MTTPEVRSSASQVCRQHWTLQEPGQTKVQGHFCRQPVDHEGPCICSCGAVLMERRVRETTTE